MGAELAFLPERPTRQLSSHQNALCGVIATARFLKAL